MILDWETKTRYVRARGCGTFPLIAEVGGRGSSCPLMLISPWTAMLLAYTVSAWHAVMEQIVCVVNVRCTS